ncbi:MAG: sulfate transporter CysZ [Pseudomonadota bacterium]
MIADFFNGARHLGYGFKLIRAPALRKFVAIPLAINVVIFIGLIAVGLHYYGLLIDWLTPDFIADWKDIWLIGWLIGLLEVLLWMIFGAAVLIILTYTFTLVANFIAAPFNSLLAEKAEHHLRGDVSQSNESLAHVLHSIPKTLASELHKLVYLLLWMIPLLILTWIPVLNLAAPFLWFAFGAWMLALEYLDYPMGNNDYRFGQIKTFMKSRRGIALGFGGGITLMTAIPIVNLIAMPVSVCAATSIWVNDLSQDADSTSA